MVVVSVIVMIFFVKYQSMPAKYLLNKSQRTKALTATFFNIWSMATWHMKVPEIPYDTLPYDTSPCFTSAGNRSRLCLPEQPVGHPHSISREDIWSYAILILKTLSSQYRTLVSTTVFFRITCVRCILRVRPPCDGRSSSVPAATHPNMS